MIREGGRKHATGYEGGKGKRESYEDIGARFEARRGRRKRKGRG